MGSNRRTYQAPGLDEVPILRREAPDRLIVSGSEEGLDRLRDELFAQYEQGPWSPTMNRMDRETAVLLGPPDWLDEFEDATKQMVANMTPEGGSEVGVEGVYWPEPEDEDDELVHNEDRSGGPN